MLGSKDAAMVKWTPESGWVCLAHAVLPRDKVLACMRHALKVYKSRELPRGERGDKMRAAVKQLERLLNAGEPVAVVAFPRAPGSEVPLLAAPQERAKLISIGGLN